MSSRKSAEEISGIIDQAFREAAGPDSSPITWISRLALTLLGVLMMKSVPLFYFILTIIPLSTRRNSGSVLIASRKRRPSSR